MFSAGGAGRCKPKPECRGNATSTTHVVSTSGFVLQDGPVWHSRSVHRRNLEHTGVGPSHPSTASGPTFPSRVSDDVDQATVRSENLHKKTILA